MSSKSYDIYKEEVGGKTFNGEDMKPFEDLPEKIQNAWKAIDKHIHIKEEITESPTYELYRSKNKEALPFDELPENIKKTWSTLDKNYDKIVKSKKPKASKAPKAKKENKEEPHEVKTKPQPKAKPVKVLNNPEPKTTKKKPVQIV